MLYIVYIAHPPDSPENKDEVDSGETKLEIEKVDVHRGDADLHVSQEESKYDNAPDSPASNSLEEGKLQEKQGSESNVVPPENSSEQIGGDSNAAAEPDHEYSNISGGGAIGGYCGDDDEDRGTLPY